MEVVQSEDRGRFLRATKRYSPGDVVLQEKPFVFASWHPFNCIACEDFHEAAECAQVARMFPKIAGSIGDVEAALSALDCIEEVDRARTVLKCLWMFQASPTSRARLLQTFEALTVANRDKIRGSIEHLPTDPLLRKILPEDCTLDILTMIIGGLNTNCHTLEDLGGSGLFENSCICQHSCVANCNFSTNGILLTLTATKEIAAGESLTLDYGENFFKPVSFRREFLLKSYGFVCDCPACNGQLPDRTRGFLCPQGSGKEHVVFPPLWKCGCGHSLTAEEIERCRAWENKVKESEPVDLEQIQNWMTHPENKLHKYHYLFFEVIDECAHELALECSTKDECIEQELELIWRMLIDCLEFAVAEDNPIRVNYYDEFAQVFVKMGNLAEAKSCYGKAYDLARRLIGPEDKCEATKKLKMLWEKPPATVEELYTHYSNVELLKKELEYERLLMESQDMMEAVKLS